MVWVCGRQHFNEVTRTSPATLKNLCHHACLEDNLFGHFLDNGFQETGINTIKLIAWVSSLHHLHNSRTDRNMCSLNELHHIYAFDGNILAHHPRPDMNILLSQFSKDGCIHKQRLSQVRFVRILLRQIPMAYQETSMIIALTAPVLTKIYTIHNWFRQGRFGVTTHSNNFSLQGSSIHVVRCPFAL